MKANLLRLQSEWETFQSTHARDAVYQYLTAVFELVAWWACKRVGQSTVHLRHCACEDILLSGSRNPSEASFLARPIWQRLMI